MVENGKPALIVVGGPTASGKTSAAAHLARHLRTEVISADARQFYHAMRIGTARPLAEELLGVPHHFIGHLELTTTWSAGEFARQAEPVLQDILARNGSAVLVGGSGLYVDALCSIGLDDIGADPLERERLQGMLNEKGLPALVENLKTVDPATHAVIDRNNPHRVIRALEVFAATGRPVSELRKGRSLRSDIQLCRIALDLPRAELYARIDQRVDRMVDEGLVEEAHALLPYRHTNALNTVGYKELFAHFDGDLALKAAIALIKQHTRNYAKRQLTWLRRDTAWNWLPPDTEKLIAHVEAMR